MKGKKGLISVIVPVYNIESYLEICLDSVCNQTYKNIQIILVNDGSTDQSGEICQQYARRDTRIAVVNKKNGGLVSARKAGLEQAAGDYIYFVDGDDWIDHELLEKVMCHMPENDDVDIIAFGCIEEYSEYQISRYNLMSQGLYKGDRLADLKEKILMGNYFFQWRVLPHLCNKIIKRELISSCLKNVPDTVSFGEDAACAFPCLLSSNSVMLSDLTPYHYRQRQGSIVKMEGELEPEKFTELYRTLYNAMNGDVHLVEQLKYYMFFVLCLKAYSNIKSDMVLFPFSKVRTQNRVLVYGAGGFGRVIKNFVKASDYLTLAGWTDKRAEYYQNQRLEVISKEEALSKDFDIIVIAILDEKVGLTVKQELEQTGIGPGKIDYVQTKVLKKQELPMWLAAALV